MSLLRRAAAILRSWTGAERPLRRTPVVYTMGKVASSSVSDAILAGGIRCFDIHTLRPEALRRNAQDWLDRGKFPPQHICEAMGYRDRILTRPRQCLYISLVREPVERNLSAFFQTLHLDAEASSETDARVLFRRFLDTFPHSLPLTWFDHEFVGQLGIDIFDRPFDRQAGYVHLRGRNTVIFRIDCPDEVKSRVLSDILGRRIHVRRRNDSRDKDYRDRYEAVKAVAVFPETLVETLYDSKFARHFWSEGERAAFRARWTAAA